MEYDVLNIIYYLAVILLSTKLMGLFTRKIGLPQVVGMVLAGLLIGPSILGHLPGFGGLIHPTVVEMDVLQAFSQVGVIFILFSSGLETDFQELKKTGFASTMIALAGVLVPLILGTGLALLFMGGFARAADHKILMNALLIGTILTATSVGITVETLRELGRLNTRVGTIVLSAAIIDDVIGILVLSLVTGLDGGTNIGITLLKAVLFFVCGIGVGLIIRKIFEKLQALRPHTRRLGIFSVATCFFYAYCAERFFGIAAITGAYLAGVLLSGERESEYVERRVLINGYLLFSPIFFAYIGISADFSQFRPSDLVFGLAFVAIGVVGKIVGCALSARACGYRQKDALTIGCGMIARGEVALAVYATGAGLVYRDASGAVLGLDPLVATIMLIVLSSILCPVFLKLLFREMERAVRAN